MRAMKDSGIEWIGRVPASWNILKLKYICSKIERGTAPNYTDTLITRVVNQATFSKGYFDNSNIRYSTIPAATSRGLLKAEDVLLASTGGGVLGKTHYFTESDEYVADSHVTIVRALPAIAIGRFIYYCFFVNFDLFNATMAKGSTNQTELQRDLLANMQLPLPNIAEQEIIISFLNSKCSELDALSADIQKEIEILEQYKRSVITEAVTKGLNPNVEMKNSGIEWVGKIPKHWETSRIKYICSFQPSCNTHITDMNTVVSYAPMECIKNGYYIKRSICYRDMPKSLTPFQNEDIVMAKVTPCFENGNIAIMSNLDSGIGFGSSELFVFRATKMNTRYLFYWLQNTSFTKKAVSTMTGMGGLKRVSPEFIQNSAICVPPDSEQSKISGYLDNVCSEIATAIASKTSQLEVLDSYKKSLIYEYVTGKKEVPATN